MASTIEALVLILTHPWYVRMVRYKMYHVLSDTAKERGLLSTLLRKRTSGRISERDIGLLVSEYIGIHGPQLITTAHKFEDSILKKHQRVCLSVCLSVHQYSFSTCFLMLLASRLPAAIHCIRMGLYRA